MLEVDDYDGFIEGTFRADPVAISSTRPRLHDLLRIREHEELGLGSYAQSNVDVSVDQVPEAEVTTDHK